MQYISLFALNILVFLIGMVAAGFAFWFFRPKNKLLRFLGRLWIIFLSLGLLLGLCRGGVPRILTVIEGPVKRDLIRTAESHFTWYDRLLVLSYSSNPDYWNSQYYLKMHQEQNNPRSIDIYQKEIQRFGTCVMGGEEGTWVASYRTWTFFGIEYKNFLVSCNEFGFNANEGLGRYLPH